MKVRVTRGNLVGSGFFARPGDVVEVSEPEARSLLHRGVVEELEASSAELEPRDEDETPKRRGRKST